MINLNGFTASRKRSFLQIAWLLGLLCQVGWGRPVQAQEAASPAPTEVSTQYSRVYILVDKSGVVGHQHAIEGKLRHGQLSFQPEKLGSLSFDMPSFDADTLRARQYLGLSGETDEATRGKVNANMLGPEILDVQHFPEARLDKVRVQAKSSKSARDLPECLMSGEFTLHGKTRPVEVLCDHEMKNGWHHLRGAFRIKQSDFGIKPFSKMMGAIGVADELVIHGELWIAPE
jgi:hypothetical protein